MADDQFRQINGPHGPINFPSSMSDDDVTHAMRKLYPPIQQIHTPTTQERVGSMIPDWAVSPLETANKYLVQPSEKASAWGAHKGGEMFEQGVAALPGTGVGTSNRGTNPLLYNQAQNEQQHPVTSGIAKGVGETTGGMVTDPRNWPFMASSAARPILQKLITVGFGGMMAQGTVGGAKQLHDQWDDLTPNERAQMATQVGLSGAMTAMSAAHIKKTAKAHEIPIRKDTPIAASGKMESEAKVETTPPVNSSPKTGSSVSPPAPSPTPVEAPKSEIPLAGARANLTSPPESGIMVGEGEEKPVFNAGDLRRALPNKPVPKLGTSPKPEVKPDIPTDTTRLITNRMMQLRRQGLSDPEQVFQLTREFPEQSEDIIRGYKTKQVPQETPSASQAVQPKESIPTASTPEKAGESVPPTPRPEVARTEPRSAARIQGLPDLNVFNKRVAEMLKKSPGMAEGTAKRRVAEQIRNEAGAVRFGGDDDVPQRRERKIAAWMNRLSDPSVEQDEALRLIKNLRSYGLSNDDIVKGMSGAKDFAKTKSDADESLEERIGDPKAFSHDDMDDLAFDKGLSAPVDRVMGTQERAFSPAYDPYRDVFLGTKRMSNERENVGNASIAGVKDPAVEELDNIFRRPDPRKAEREDERGSLSFRRLPKEKREEYHPLARLADVLDKVANFFEGNRGLEPEAIADKKLAKNIIREAGSGLALSHLQVEAKLDDAIKRHDSPLNERENFVSFMDAGEGKPGASFLHPEDQALSNELHSMFEERWDRVKTVKGLESDGIDNYLAHIWEKPGKAGQVLSGILTGKRPLEGSARFLKNRFYQFASTGIDHGLTPVSWNPIRLQLQALFDTDRFLMAHEIKDRFKDAGLVSWVGLSNYKNVPPGWARLDDKIFQPKVAGEGALKEYGTYYAPPEVAKVFNNYLSPGLGKSPLYRNIRGYQNRLNMINLGISAYHGTMIGLVASTSDLALGLQKVANNKDIGGLKDIFRGTIGTFILRSAAQDYKLGRDIQNEATNPTGKPWLHTYVDLLQQGGAWCQHVPCDTQGMSDRKGFLNSLKLVRKLFIADSPQDTGFRGVSKNATELLDRTVRGLSAPIMDKYVPRIKLGAASRMMEAKLHHMVIEQGITDQGAIADEMGKIWDSVDNRAGQMVYDNLFWNKTAKDLSFLGVRAVGWDLGSAREYGGAMLADLPRQMAKGLRGERPELTSRLAFTMATPITIGIFGAALHYMMTGKAPQKPEDYFFPGPDGSKISFPSYMKDFYSFKSQPFKTAVNKLHPSISQMYQMYENADFYGTEIYHPGDDKFKQGVDILKWYGSTFAPLAVTGVQRRLDRGEVVGSAASSLFGFMPAPASIGQTKAEDLAYTLAQRGWQAGPRTRGDADRHALVQKFQQELSSGQKINKDVIQAWKQHRIQDSDLDKIYDTARDSKLLRDFKELHLPDALAVMRTASPSERVQLKPYLIDKYDEIDRYPVDIQHEYTRQVSSYMR